MDLKSVTGEMDAMDTLKSFAVVINNQQHPVRVWTWGQRNTMNETKQFRDELSKVLSDLEKTGRTKQVNLPPFPRRKFLEIMNGPAQKKPVLIEQHLHNYLANRLVEINEQSVLDIPIVSMNENTSLTEVEAILNRVNQFFQNNRSRNLNNSINLGRLLKDCQHLFELRKGAGCVTKTWKEFLKTTAGIDDSYARKLFVCLVILVYIVRYTDYQFHMKNFTKRKLKLTIC